MIAAPVDPEWAAEDRDFKEKAQQLTRASIVRRKIDALARRRYTRPVAPSHPR